MRIMIRQWHDLIIRSAASATASASALLAVTAVAMGGQQENVQSTITRVEIYLEHATMTQAVAQGLTSVLYNRISQITRR
jgi:hypothetical protein